METNKQPQYPKVSYCSAFGVSRSAFYHNLKVSRLKKQKDRFLKEVVERIVLEFAGYGYRRVTKELKNRGFHVNHKRVLRIMKENNLLCRSKKQFKVTTCSNHRFRIYPNLIKDLVITRISQVWVADITYVRLIRGFVYLAVMLDAYSKKVLGWSLRRDLTENLTLEALKMTLNNRKVPKGLIHHSDQGVQYASTAYTRLLKEHSILISMAAKGNPYENAYAESFIKTLKQEEVYLNEYESFEEAKERIEHFIEDVYNRKRLHSSIGYLSPAQFEASLTNSLSVPI